MVTKIDSKFVPVMRKQYTEQNKIRFAYELQLIDWEEVYLINDAQASYTKFYQTVKDLYDACFPIKTVKSVYKTRCTWLSRGLKKSIKVTN